MKIFHAYKTELKPNHKQQILLRKHAGVARFAYNWGLARKKVVLGLNQLPIPRIKVPTAIALHKELNKLKKTEFQWMYEVSKCAPQEALRDLDKASNHFLEDRARFPKFKTKKHDCSFRLTGAIHILDDRIQLPRLGKIRLKERGYIPKNTHILSATVSENAGRWFVSVLVEEDIEPPTNNGGVVGVDLGVRNLATVSDGTIFQNPKSLSRFERKLKRTQREVARKKNGSKNRSKSTLKLRKIYARIADIRKDAIHKATTWLARTKSIIVVEELNLLGMVKSHPLASSILDASLGVFNRQLRYKSQWYGSKVVVADAFYPSSKMCSVCGYVKDELPLSERVFECETCHSKIDRDLNASINLQRLAASSTESINACLRWEVAEHPKDVQCPSMIQESNTDRNVLSG